MTSVRDISDSSDAQNAPVKSGGRKPVHPNVILAICCMSLLLVGLDVTIVNVALPAIQKNLQASISDLQWVIDAYTLVVATLLMFSGSMSDRFGRRRTFQLGLVIFTLGSLFCSLAPNIHALIAFRAMQGLGASMLNPVALSIISNVFHEPKARARAIGIWGAVFGIAFALGPLLGGVLTQTVGWRYIFLVNLPIGIAAVVLTGIFVPESKALRARAIDPLGQILVFTTLVCLTSAVIEGPHVGWGSGRSVALFVVAAASLIGLLLYEPHRTEPLIELRFFRSIPFSGAAIIGMGSFACFAGLLFLNALYLQQARGFSAFQTGLCTLPLAATGILCGPLSGRMTASYGTRPPLLIAGTGILAGTLILTALNDHTPLFLLLFAYTLFGIGLGTVIPVISTVAVSGMPRSQAGVAAAIASTSRQVGAALGVAIAGTVVHISRTHGAGFAHATHPIWWAMAACGGIITLLGWATNTPQAHTSARQVAALMQPAAS